MKSTSNVASVNSATNFSRNGVSDWLIQRASAVILALYTLTMVIWFAVGNDGYYHWYSFMMSMPMKVFSILTILALVGHAWVGVWTIGTDYLKNDWLRLGFQLAVATTLLVYMIWALTIFWG